MIDLLRILLLNAIFCNGVFLLFSEGHIFSLIKSKFVDKLPSYINKPLWSCVMCMASVWGIVFLIVMNNYHNIGFVELGVYLPALAFLNGFICHLKTMIISNQEAASAKVFEIFNKK